MLKTIITILVLSMGVTGCVKTVKESKNLIRSTPDEGPEWAGTLDFDLIDRVVGKACVSEHQATYYYVNVEGADLGKGMGLRARSEAAAAWDAMKNIEDADMLIVTKMFTEGEDGRRLCTELHGWAAKIKKGPTKYLNEAKEVKSVKIFNTGGSVDEKIVEEVVEEDSKKEDIETGCKRNRDCEDGFVCRKGKCEPKENPYSD